MLLLSRCSYCKVNRSYGYRSLTRAVSKSAAPGSGSCEELYNDATEAPRSARKLWLLAPAG